MNIRLHALALLAMVLLPPTARAIESDGLGPAGVFMLGSLPACLEEDFTNAYTKCLPPRPSPTLAGDARVKAWIDRAVLLIYMRRWDDAREELDFAIAANPQQLKARHLAARLAITAYMDQRNRAWLDAARSHIAMARKLAPRSADVRASEAFLLNDSGRIDDAIIMYGEAISLRPDHAFSLGQRGMLLEVKGWPERAAKDYDRAISISPADPVLRRARAGLLVSMGKLREAAEDLTVILKQNVYDFMAVATRAAVYQALGDHEAALEDLNTVIFGPKDGMPFATGGEQLSGFLMQRAMVLYNLNRLDEAADDMVHAVELGGKREILRLQVYLRQNGFSELTIDGTASMALSAAIKACFGKAECRDGLSRNG